MEKYYVSQQTQKRQRKLLNDYEKKIDNDSNYLNQFQDNYVIEKLRDRLIYNLCERLIRGSVTLESFVQKTYYYE